MSIFRRLPTSRLLALCALVVVTAAGASAIALAAESGGPVPPPKPLANAIHGALTAPAVQGVTARISFTNKLIDGSSLRSGGPLLSGASGRLWVGSDGRVRLELQSDRGDAQVVSDGHTLTLYDESSNTAYRLALPSHDGAARKPEPGEHHGPPTIAQIKRALSRFMQHADVSGAIPTDIAGEPAYSVRISPKHDGGLIGAVALAWDAARGVPLRAAVYAQGTDSPILDLEATDISFGRVPASVFKVAVPRNAKVVQVRTPPAGKVRRHGHMRSVTGVDAVQARLPFKLSAPSTLVGLPRREVKLLGDGRRAGALVLYGQGLGGMVVLEQPAKQGDIPNESDHSHDGERLNLPTVSIGGSTGVELSTALGTAVRFGRGGVTYTVLGSVPAEAAEAAARGL